MKAKTALITGASRGIGRAAAERFAAAGYHLILNCIHREDLLQDLCSRLSAQYHVRCLPFKGDVADPELCGRMFALAKTEFAGLDVLINNAGISSIGLMQDLSPSQWDQIIRTNLSSVFYCSRLAVPLMLSAGQAGRESRGKILNVSSIWGEDGASCETAYSASKGGVNAFTKALAKELAPSSIQVNALACGAIDTDMNRHLTKNDLQALVEEIPAGRLGAPDEAARMLLLLAEAPAYLTGQIITLDGGWR